jgi:hypothetical protein
MDRSSGKLLSVAFLKSSLEIRNQGRKGVRLFMGSEVTSRQAFDPEAELSQSLLRESNLPRLEGIFVTAAYQERELIAISLEEVTEVEPVFLRFVIRHEAGCCGQVEEAIVPVQRAVELAELGICYVIVFGPHLPYSWHPLKQPQRAANPLAGSVRETAQHRRGVPRVGVTVGKKPAIKDENSAYLRPAGRFATLGTLKPTSQVLENHKRGKVESNQRRRLDAEIAPDRFDKIRTLGG